MKEYTDAECQQLFQDLFPNGFASDDLMHTLAPNGWENTPFVMPTPSIENAYQGAITFFQSQYSVPTAYK